MFQVGLPVSLSISSITGTGSNIYSYVWKLWDGSVMVTTTPSTPCFDINMGGQPGANNLNYSVTPVQLDGQNVVLNGSILCNNPPSLYPTPTITPNDGLFPFQTELKVVAFDMDNDILNFAWFSGVTALGNGTSIKVGNVTGTWIGNGTTLVGNYAGTQNTFDWMVRSDQTLSVLITDGNGGETSLDFHLRGSDAPPPQIGVSGAISGLLADAADLPEQRIGIGQSVTFSVYGKDASGIPVNFLWSFAGSNNWTTGPEFTTGTIAALPDGGFQSTYTKDVSMEVVTVGTQKVATAVATVIGPTSQTSVEQQITLIANTAPTSVDFSVKNFGTVINFGNDSSQGDLFPAGTQFEFEAVANDPNNDIVEYFWRFDQPAGVSPQTLSLWGAKVSVDTSQYPDGSTVSGNLVVTDRMGGTFVTDTPFVSIFVPGDIIS
jgi:hypothetical protein